MVVSRFDLVWVDLDPTVGKEIKKTRPCVVISPDEMNQTRLGVLIVAPLTSTIRNFPTRVPVKVEGKLGEIALDQLRAIDRVRIVSIMNAHLSDKDKKQILHVLQEMFA